MRVAALVALACALIGVSGCGGSSSDDAARGVVKIFQNSDNADELLRWSQETGMRANKSREASCFLLKTYEEEGPAQPFVSWAMSKSRAAGAIRFRIEGVMEDLEEAIGKAEEGDGLGALVSSVCAP